MKLFFSFFICLFFYQSHAQSISVHIKVVDNKTGQPIALASVQSENTQEVILTNDKGLAQFKGLKNRKHTFMISCVGYITEKKSMDIAGAEDSLTVRLKSNEDQLKEVKVFGLAGEEAEAKKIRSNVMPVTIITSKQIENRASNLNEILARQAGVNIRMSGGLGSESRISVRGLEGKRVQVFIDGNPLNTPDGSLGINDLPLQIIERIEIYKGSVPAWLGGDGLGSAVNVITREREVSYIDASISRQTYNTQTINLLLKKALPKQGIEAGLGIFDTRSDNNYTMELPTQPGYFVKRDHDKFHSFLIGGSVKFHKWWFDEIEVEGAFVGINKQVQGITKNIQHVESKGKSYVGILNMEKKNFANNKLGLKYTLIRGVFDVKFIDTSSLNYNWDGSSFPSSLGKGELGTGPNMATNLQKDLRQRFNLDYRLTPTFSLNLNNTARLINYDPEDNVGNDYAGKNLYNYPGTVQNSITGLTAEKRWWEDKLLISAAVKHYYNKVQGYNTSIYLNNSVPDKVNNQSNEIGYTTGLRYNITQPLFVKASFEKGIRLPQNTELFGDGVLITPNTNLQPEVAHNTNLGAVYDITSQNEKRLQLDVNAFFMRVQNLIQLSGNALTIGYVNFAKASIAGADAEVKYDITKNIYASVNGTYQVLKDINKYIPGTTVSNPTYNRQIPNTPQLFFNWNIEYHKLNLLGNGTKTRIIYDGSYVKKYNYGFAISVYDHLFIPSHLTHTLSVEQSFKDSRYTVSAEVNNLTDAVVINNFNQPLPGRTFRVKLRYLFLSKSNKSLEH